MINIITTIRSGSPTIGSAKVFRNLVKGLDRLGYPYIVNRALDAADRLWIHNDVFALPAVERRRQAKVVGPNLFILPTEIPVGMQLRGAIYLQPSEWVKALWERCGFDDCPIVVWPVGIDTNAFAPRAPSEPRGHVLVYHKHRDVTELDRIHATLAARRMSFSTIVYGRYSEAEYRRELSSADWVIWHGSHETQGIALLEALACGVPVLVCDAVSLGQLRSADYAFPRHLHDHEVTSAPYFDDSCGIKIRDIGELPWALDTMKERLSSFAPRDYVVGHLSLERQARSFVDIWRHWGLTFDQGLNEPTRSMAKWRPAAVDVLGLRVRRRLRLIRSRDYRKP